MNVLLLLLNPELLLLAYCSSISAFSCSLGISTLAECCRLVDEVEVVYGLGYAYLRLLLLLLLLGAAFIIEDV